MSIQASTILLIIIYAISGLVCMSISWSYRKLGKNGDGWMFCAGCAFGFVMVMLIHLFL